MGVQLPIWMILVLAAAHFQQHAHAQMEPEDPENYDFDDEVDNETYGETTLISSGSPTRVARPLITAHNDQVCSTWGNYHFKTFDGVVFHFPGTCNYLLASNCKDSYEEFNIQIRRMVEDNMPTISHITMRIEGEVVELSRDSVKVNNEVVHLPYSHSGIQMDRNGLYLRVSAKTGLNLMWNEEDALLLELDGKFVNKTCGLCGDFNDIPQNEFISNGYHMSPLQYGNLQKINGPTETCNDLMTEPLNKCTDHDSLCEDILTGASFHACNFAVNVAPYIEACEQDLCRCNNETESFCLCNNFAEYSRQCAHAGSTPLNWRTPELCPITCPFNMLHQECDLPCVDTCSNSEQSELCEDHCSDGCYCPKGMVYDDINNSGCIKQEECPCIFNDETYALGTGYETACHSCNCAGGTWNCKDLPCPGICSVDGGSHISTFDDSHYNFHGDCTYVLVKHCTENSFNVMVELRKCGLTDSETCLKSVTVSLNDGDTTFFIKPCGTVLMDMSHTELPIIKDDFALFSPASFFIVMHTKMGMQLEIQLVPNMQVRVKLDPHMEGKTCGLCGNFNKNQADDFQTMSGIVEGTGASFANSWKTQSDCPNIKNIHDNPCSLSIENEKYAEHWCEMLSDPVGPFEECHSIVDPDKYEKNCMFDTCNCENSEDCMCSAVSSYVRDCAAMGVFLTEWRSEICGKYTKNCPKTQTYSPFVDTCQATCRSLSEPDPTCDIKFTPLDGCVCPEGTYKDETGMCLAANQCSCYYKGSAVSHGEVVHDNNAICTCSQGKLSCIGSQIVVTDCVAPMVFFECSNATMGSKGSECQKSCQTLDVECYSTHCVSGCVCPDGLVLDGKGGCIQANACPCVHNEVHYQPGDTMKVSCNTCTCKNRMWDCTKDQCMGTCIVYGDGHYITFDSKRFNFDGNCEYTLAQDYCGNGSAGSYRVMAENKPCGTTGSTCTKSINLFLGGYELKLHEEHIDLVERDSTVEVPYKIRSMGIYMVIEAKNGMVLMWDKGTTIIIKLASSFQGNVCGLCGNYDLNGMNDYTTRSQSIVGDVLEFGNSWKATPTCPDALEVKDPCSTNPYRKSWAQKQCSIITSNAFSTCHSQVDHSKYYEACVTDSCACDTGGDCECFCTAVAAYAQACSEAGVCIHWRTPTICPLFCDFYNPDGNCEWHYKPCGAPCLKTCVNPSGKCLYELKGLEGCYPSCPEERPYFDEESMSCTAYCGCYDKQGNLFKPGDKVSTQENCKSCTCGMNGFKCAYDTDACTCEYDGKKYKYNEVIYRTGDSLGGCFIATCAANGTINREITECSSTTPSTTFTFTTGPPTSSVTTPPITTTVCVHEVCSWTEWFDHSYPSPGNDKGDYETLANLIENGEKICKTPRAARCRAERFPDEALEDLNQTVECSPTVGLICNNKDQFPPQCLNMEISFECCSYVPCGSTTIPTSTTTSPTTTGTEETTTRSTGTTSATTTPPTTSTVTETTTSTTTGETSTSTAATTTTQITTPVSTTEGGCQPICHWTTWFDEDNDDDDDDDERVKGDNETFSKILESGHTICGKTEKIEDIECRAEHFKEIKIEDLNQVVTCSKSIGLICNDDDQVNSTCYNYEMRVKCCDYSQCTTTAGTSVPSTTTATETPSTTGPTTITETTTTSGTTPSTPIITFPTTTGETPSTTTSTTTAKESTTSQVTTTSRATPSPAPETTVTTGSTSPSPSAPETTYPSTAGKPTTPPTTPPSTTSETTTIRETTTTPSTTTVTETTSPVTVCKPNCNWSKWFNDKNVASENSDGENLTFTNIEAAGEKICSETETVSGIECRAENFPDTDIADVGQNVQCNVTFGLVCENADQTGEGDEKICYKYEMRVRCCDYSYCTTTTSPTTTVTETTTQSTTTGTEPTTTTGSTTNIVTGTTTSPSTTSKTTTVTETTTPSTTAGTETSETETPSTEETTSITTGETSIKSTTETTSITEITTPSTTSSTTPGTTTITPTTSPESTGNLTTTARTPATPTTGEISTTTSQVVTTPCFCKVNDTLVPPGGLLYNTTDKAGCQFYATCSETCQPERVQGPCTTPVPTPPGTTTPSTPGSTTPTTTPSTAEISSATTSPTSGWLPTTVNPPPTWVPEGCFHVMPPRLVNETWDINDCATATCEKDGNITIKQKECPTVNIVTCESGVNPKKVYDKSGCCYQYECESCVGPDGNPKMPGESWTSNCQQCACDKETITVKCAPMKCAEPTPTNCTAEGYELIEELDPNNPCCTIMACKCNPRLCFPKVTKCQIGFRLTSIMADGDCCATMQCVPEEVCVFRNTTYQPGSTIPQDEGSCKVCDCSQEMNPQTQLFNIICKDLLCQTECRQGYEYTMKAGKCCGECEQKACVIKTENNDTKVIQVGESWNPEGNNCTYYKCSEDQGIYTPITVERACQYFNESTCQSGIIETTSDGCCKICKQREETNECRVHVKPTVLAHGECNITVNLPICEGLCNSASMFSSMTQAMEHKCTCCQELRTKERETELTCPDGNNIGYSYISVEECGCVGAVCVPQEGTQAIEETSRRRRRR